MKRWKIPACLATGTLAALLTLCVPTVALSAEDDWAAEEMSTSLFFGYNRVDGADSMTMEIDFSSRSYFYGIGFFMIDNGNMPDRYRDYPAPSSVSTVDAGWYDDSETGAYVSAGSVVSELRVFGIVGGSDVTSKHLERSTSTGTYYVIEEETGDFQMVYGGGVGYLLAERVLVQYQYDNRRNALLMVGISF